MITYLNALWESGERYEGDDTGSKPCHPAGMLYFKIDDPIIRSNSRISEEEIEKSIRKQLKMRGLLLADVRLIKKMDNNINGTSTIIPATINKGDVLGKNTSEPQRNSLYSLRNMLRSSWQLFVRR